MRIGSLCTGCGGLDMAVQQLLGGELAWVADSDRACAFVLNHHYPDVPNLGDVTTVDWGSVPPVDVMCMGFPCQDVSAAGRRAGLRPGTRSGVWLHCARAIAVLRPRLVIIENVRGLLSADAHSDVESCPGCLGEAGREHALRASGAVLGDLAYLGFDAQWEVVSASEVGAPHERKRVFILAWPAADRDCLDGCRTRALEAWGSLVAAEPGGAEPGGYRDPAPDAGVLPAGPHPGGGGAGPPAGAGDGAWWGGRPGPVGGGGPAAGPGDRADAGRPWHPGRDAGQRAAERPVAGPGGAASAHPAVPGPERATGDRSPPQRRLPGQPAGQHQGPARWGRYWPAISRWEGVLGRAAPSPVEPGRSGERLSPAFAEWMMGFPAGWVTGVPALPRGDQLKIIGNGAVPQQAMAAIYELLRQSSDPFARRQPGGAELLGNAG